MSRKFLFDSIFQGISAKSWDGCCASACSRIQASYEEDEEASYEESHIEGYISTYQVKVLTSIMNGPSQRFKAFWELYNIDIVINKSNSIKCSINKCNLVKRIYSALWSGSVTEM